MSIIICICNILICISAAISALYWFASSCVKIVEPGNYIYNDSPKAKDYENFFQKNTCDNKPKKVIYNCIHETFIQCFYGTYKDLYSFFSDYSIAHFFHFHEINNDLFSAIHVSGLLNQRAAFFSALTAFFTFISMLIDFFKGLS